MRNWDHYKATFKAGANDCECCRKYAIGSLPDDRHRCRRCRIRSIALKANIRCNPLGAGPAIAEGIRAPLSACFTRPSCDSGRHKPSCRRVVGDGRRAALSVAECCDWRDLGHPACLKLHRHKTTVYQGGILQDPVLADPARYVPRHKCCAEQVARGVLALASSPGRCQGPRRPTLASRAVSITYAETWHMGGDL